ncbi:MAG: hypothetical protein Q9208_007403, partial [Pyrenodesmia sp. 3 TL-2023]
PEGNKRSQIFGSRTWVLPDTPYSITFDRPTAPLDPDHARRCIIFARSQIDSYIKRHGDKPIPGGLYSLIYGYRSVYFTIEPADPPTQRRLRYSDTVKVLTTYAVENTLEKFRQRSAVIFVTDGGEMVATAFLGLDEDDDKERKDLQFALPNPYPMPGTAFSIDFSDDHGAGPLLVGTAVVHCLNVIRREVVQHIDQIGNVPVITTTWNIAGLTFNISPIPRAYRPQLLDRDFLAVLDAFSKKMIREGCRARHAQIFVTDGALVVGNAHIAPEAVDAQGAG